MHIKVIFVKFKKHSLESGGCTIYWLLKNDFQRFVVCLNNDLATIQVRMELLNPPSNGKHFSFDISIPSLRVNQCP